MIYKNLYGLNSEVFLGYIKNTNQKKILFKKIKVKLQKKLKKGNQEYLVFTDIGGGNGEIDLNVISFFRKKVNLNINFIEPSKKLMQSFKKKNKHDDTNYINEKVQDIKIPQSDFILSSHSIYYLENLKELIDSIINSLKKEGIALIVKTNKESQDTKLRKLITKKKGKKDKNYFDIPKYLMKKKIIFEEEIVSSHIKIKDCFKMNEKGKNIFSFLYKKPFNEISEEEIDLLKKLLKKNSERGKITKLEDYIWVYKP